MWYDWTNLNRDRKIISLSVIQELNVVIAVTGSIISSSVWAQLYDMHLKTNKSSEATLCIILYNL